MDISEQVCGDPPIRLDLSACGSISQLHRGSMAQHIAARYFSLRHALQHSAKAGWQFCLVACQGHSARTLTCSFSVLPLGFLRQEAPAHYWAESARACALLRYGWPASTRHKVHSDPGFYPHQTRPPACFMLMEAGSCKGQSALNSKLSSYSQLSAAGQL